MTDKLLDLFIREEANKGVGGVLYVKGEEYSYLFSNQFPNKDFASKLQDILDDDGKKNIYFVIEKEGTLHLMSHSRERLVYTRANN